MLRIAALNDASSEEETWGRKPSHKTTKEAQESEAMATYNHALSLQRKGSLAAAEEAFTKLLQSSFLKQVTVSSEDEESMGLVQTSHVLKYSTYTNLAGLCTQRGDQNTAMEYYLQAVNLDSSDVSLWYKIGTLASKIHNYSLARHAFEQGLECNSRHWPCLDRVITVLYTLNNYIACLSYISQALQKDPGYIKGLVIKEQIFKEQPGLRHDTLHLFEQCGEDLSDDGIEDSDKQEIIEEALLMRRKKQERERRPPIPVVSFTQPLTSLTWKNVGERLVSLYDFIVSGKSDARLVSKLDLSSYQTLDPSVPLQQAVPMETEPVQTQQQAAVHTPLENQSKDVTMTTESTVLPAQDMSGMDESFTQPAKRGPKRKRMVPEDGAGKRRSARVRNTSKKKEEESINFKEILQEFLPSSLLRATETSEEAPPQGESHVEPMDLSARSEEENQSTPAGSQKGVNNQAGYQTEQVDVHNFLKLCVENSGIIDVTNQYLIEVANRMQVAWPPGLTEVYLKAYSRIRKHLRMPNVLCKDEPDERFGDLGQMCLVYAELKMDQWIASRNRGASLSPRKSPGAPAVLGPDFPGQFFTDDLEFLLDLTGSPSTMSHKWLDLCLRVCWMRGHYLVLCGKTDFAGAVYFKCFTYLDLAEAEGQATTIHLPYCTIDNTISAKTVQQQLESLERCQSLEAVQRLHDSGDHQQVVRLLLQTFTQPAGPDQPVSLPAAERHAQLLLLQASLLELKDYKQCLVWSEVSLNEALQQLMGAASHSSREEWGSTMVQLFQGINKCLSEDKQDHSWSLSPKNLVRLTQNLIQIIQVSMDGSDYSDYGSVNSVLPWILLYRLILHEERRLKSLQTDPDNSFDSCMPSSIMLLNMAHEYLGRRSWCTLSDGALLQFMVDEMSELLDTSATYREELEQALEQCFYCLYGHPNKRGKAKHLQDHNVAPVPLLWTHATKVFEFFKPKTVPEFDSYKTSTVSGELENLLRRIATLVPQDQTYISVDAVTSFVDGSLQQAPALTPDVPTERPVVKELYYLLADYYFKNKEQAKAIKFYILDLCENPDRFDSWAGMSLARMSRLEQKLNSHELKTEAPVQKQALAALRCFKQALQLDSSNSKLWIEHGSLAYQMHSHASRQLKQLSMFPLSEEFHQMSKDNKREMLELAYKCYSTAAQCEGEDYAEEWLHHYMLGKIAEKMNQNPKISLQHYKQAAFHLHEDHAHYPKKITYIYSPPHLALESLEVFYRMHVSILKYLLKSTGNTPYKLFEEYLQQASESPFVSMKEKKKKERRDR